MKINEKSNIFQPNITMSNQKLNKTLDDNKKVNQNLMIIEIQSRNNMKVNNLNKTENYYKDYKAKNNSVPSNYMNDNLNDNYINNNDNNEKKNKTNTNTNMNVSIT